MTCESCHSEYSNFCEQGSCYTKHLKMTSVVINIIYTYGDSDVTSSYHNHIHITQPSAKYMYMYVNICTYILRLVVLYEYDYRI